MPQPSPASPFVRLLTAERLVMTVIVVSIVATTMAAFLPVDSPQKRLLDLVDYACVLYFVVEAALKIRRYGWQGYRASGWNRFDFIVTVLCLPVLVEPWVHHDQVPLWLPVFRAGRLFRLFRFLRFIPDASNLAHGILRALKASVGVFLALALVNLIIALASTFLFGEIYPERFGDPLRASYTIFQIFTLEGWDQFPEEIAQRMDQPRWAPAVRLFFAVTVLVGGVMGLSLANAVFVDEMTLDNNRQLENKVDALTREVRSLRRALDASQRTGD